MNPREEFFHVPDDEEFWSESHYLDFVADALQGHVRLGFYPNRESANLFAYLVADDAIYAVRDEAIPPAAVHGLAVDRDAEDWRFSLQPVKLGREWTVELAGTATEHPTPAAVLAGEGDPADISVSFTARGRHEPFLYSAGRDFPSGPSADRYEQATMVEGTATMAGETVTFAGPGERDHSWGRRRWTDAEWLWISGAFDDGTAYNHLSAWLPGHPDERFVNGFWFDEDEQVHAITDATVSADPSFGVETARAWTAGDTPTLELELQWAAGATTVSVDPFATTPVDWADERAGQRAVLNRSAARQTRDGDVPGRGFLENMTQFPMK